MIRSLLTSAIAALLAFLSIQTQADETTDLGPVTVTATRTPLIADQEVAPVIVITAEQLQLAQDQDVGAVLSQYAGMDVSQSGGPGQPESLFLRGTNSNHVLVMIDGVRVNPTTLGGAPLENIRLENIERIEIVKGPRASLYGSDAIGGVINIITKRAAQGLHYGAHATAGRYATYDNGGYVNYGEGDSALSVSGDDYHTDGFPAVVGRSDDDGAIDRSFNAAGHTELGSLELALNHWQSNGYNQYLGFDFNSFAPEQVAEDFRDEASGVDLTGHLSSTWRSNLSLEHMLDEVDQRQRDPFNNPPGPDFLHAQRNILDWQNDFSLGDRQLLTAGLYTEEQHASAQSFGTAYDPTDHVNALYSEDDLDLPDQRLVLAGRGTHDQAFGNHFTWNVDDGYDLNATARLTAGAGTAFRAPNAEDRFGFGGNPNLKPETSQNLEAGLRLKIAQGQELSISTFQDKLDDLILFVPNANPPSFGQSENVGHARVRGLEVEHSITGQSWSWRTDAILQNPEDLDSSSYLLRRARRTLTAALAWHDDTTSVGLNLLLTGPRADVGYTSGAPVTDAGFALLGASLRHELGAGFAALVRVDNLLDARYQTANGYNTARRSLYLGLEYASD